MVKAPKHEERDYSPTPDIIDRPSGYEKSAERMSKELVKPSKTTALDTREFLSNIPQGLEVELSMMNGISDIVDAHLKQFDQMKDEKLSPDEKMELTIAIDGMRSIQKHLYQNWMGQKGWRADQIVRVLESLPIIEAFMKKQKDEGFFSKLREKFPF